jgi:hypothetical protein
MEDGNAKWIPSEALAKEGYLIASAPRLPKSCTADRDFAVLLVPRASPVGLHNYLFGEISCLVLRTKQGIT